MQHNVSVLLVLSWYEQKAVCILLTLLYLGIENIRLGPTLPAFVSPNILNFLVDKFKIKPITTHENDFKEILGNTLIKLTKSFFLTKKIIYYIK